MFLNKVPPLTISTEPKEHRMLRNVLKLHLKDTAYTDEEFKVILARNVVFACEKHCEKHIKANEKSLVFVNVAAEVLDLKTLKTFYAVDDKSCKLSTFYNIDNIEDINTYIKLRTIIMDHYLNLHTIPTNKSIVDQYLILHPVDTIVNDKERSKINLSKFGFVYKTLPGTVRTIIIEDPELCNDRIRYNFAISEHRENNRCIVYGFLIDFNDILKEKNFYFENKEPLAFVTVSACGVLSVEEVPNDLESHQTVTALAFESVLDLPESCVLVLPGPNSVAEEIKISSTKEQMMQILEKNDIPHNPEMHRSLLWRLIQKYKLHVNLITDDKFKAHGIDVLHRPYTMPDVSCEPLLDEVMKTVKFKVMGSRKIVQIKDVHDKFLAISDIQTKLYENEFVKIDSKMYNDDMKMEVIIDIYLHLAKVGTFSAFEISELDVFRKENAVMEQSKKLLI